MIKQTLITVLICILLVGCSEEITPTASLLTGRNVELENESTEYIGRLGVEVEGTEVGLSTIYLDRFEDGDSEADLQTYGVYVIQNLQIVDPNMPLIGKPYIGAQATLDLDDDGALYGLIIGSVTNLGGVEILTEFQTRHYDDAMKALQGESEDKYKIIVGPRFKF